MDNKGILFNRFYIADLYNYAILFWAFSISKVVASNCVNNWQTIVLVVCFI